jgi:hypothetical protein
VVTVLAENDPAFLVPVVGDSVPTIDVGLPDAFPAANSMRVQTRMARVVAE